MRPYITVNVALLIVQLSYQAINSNKFSVMIHNEDDSHTVQDLIGTARTACLLAVSTVTLLSTASTARLLTPASSSTLAVSPGTFLTETQTTVSFTVSRARTERTTATVGCVCVCVIG